VLQNIIFGTVGGLGLFIFGMKYLSEGLQKVASNKLKNIMSKVTNSRLSGILLGTFVTSIIQSSSVTTVILIGFINSGILTFIQSASVVLGANIGTTITAQIIAFNVSAYSLPMIGAGMLIMFVSKKEKIKFIGQILFSLGLIFFGLKIMSDVVKPLKDIPSITNFFLVLSEHPILGILAGLSFTVIIQSSSASIGMLIALATAGLIDFNACLYVLLGDNIGTTITAWLASIGGKSASKRLATFHSFFNIVGSIYFTFLISSGFYARFIDFVTPGNFETENIARYIANAHTFFNVINTIVFFPFVGMIAKLIEKFIPEKEVDYLSNSIKYLQDNLLETPELAFDSSKKEISEMAKMSSNVLDITFEGFLTKDNAKILKVYELENEIDKLQHDITLYLSKIVNERMSYEIANSLPVLIHSINDIERISDHAVNISEITEKMINSDIIFSEEAITDLKIVFKIIKDMAEKVNSVFYSYSLDGTDSFDSINDILILEKELNKLHKEFFEKQTQRIVDLRCSPQSSLLFIDIMNNLEKVGDHLKNIAQAASRSFILSDTKFKI
jgi:phosphate:Na+ symporter